MKKIIFTAITILSIGFASAQENAIKANPLALLGGTDLISYERKVSDNSTASLGLGFATFNFGGVTYTSTGAEVQYRYYFEEALKKWYAGGQVGYTAGKIKQDYSGFGFTQAQQPDDIKYTSFVVGAKGGYQFVFKNNIIIDLNLGFAYNKFGYSDTGSQQTFVNTLKGSAILPTFGFAVGYAF